MSFDIKADIGRVTYVDPNKFTVDIKTFSGREYEGLSFLSLYSKPNSNGQGIYMIPEINSYGLIIKLGNQETLVIGFFNPVVTSEEELSEYEDLHPGDYVLKTQAGNKIIGHADGSMTMMASSQCKIRLFPQSGNQNDSFGYDNLLRGLFENIEIVTNGGYLKSNINKKVKTTNVKLEMRNKPLKKQNPDIVRFDVGSQGPTGNDEFLINMNIYTTASNGEEEILRYNYSVKPNGWRKQTSYDQDGEKLYEVLVTESYEKIINTYIDGTLTYSQILKPTGELIEKVGENGDAYTFTRGADGQTQLNIANGKLQLTLTPGGQMYLTANENIEISTNADITVSATNAKVDASSKAEVIGTTVNVGSSTSTVNVSGKTINLN